MVCGGPAAEREVSLTSGREVAAGLRESFASVTVHEPDLRLAEELMKGSIDVVFPALHGPLGEDGSIQGMLEVAGIPYVGSNVLGSACAMDKVVAKRLFRDAALPLAREVVVERDAGADAVAQVRELLPGRVAVKPASQGSAVGVAFAETDEELAAALDQALAFDEHVLVEEFVVGSEITVGILEQPDPFAFPVIDIRTPGDSLVRLRAPLRRRPERARDPRTPARGRVRGGAGPGRAGARDARLPRPVAGRLPRRAGRSEWCCSR